MQFIYELWISLKNTIITLFRLCPLCPPPLPPSLNNMSVLRLPSCGGLRFLNLRHSINWHGLLRDFSFVQRARKRESDSISLLLLHTHTQTLYTSKAFNSNKIKSLPLVLCDVTAAHAALLLIAAIWFKALPWICVNVGLRNETNKCLHRSSGVPQSRNESRNWLNSL